uniref:Uncharacterized protein n=1 Tax=Saimiri boliviensis boliviensis TaxID=39432 RepID=A0A2K6T298_SAIBB
MKCLSFGPAPSLLVENMAGFPKASVRKLCGLGHPELAKMGGDEVLKEVTYGLVRRQELLCDHRFFRRGPTRALWVMSVCREDEAEERHTWRKAPVMLPTLNSTHQS